MNFNQNCVEILKVFADREILKFRDIYTNIFIYVEKYCESKKIILSKGTSLNSIICLNSNELNKDSYNYIIWTTELYKTAEELTNELIAFQDKLSIKTKEVIPNYQLDMIINNNYLIKFQPLIEYKNINIFDLIKYVKIQSCFDNSINLKFMCPEILIIENYRILYSPDSHSEWADYLYYEKTLYKLTKNHINVPKVEFKDKPEKMRVLNKVLKLCISPDFIILQQDDIKVKNENKIQLITNRKSKEVLQLLRELFKNKYTIELRKQDPKILFDPRLKKYTYYYKNINKKDAKLTPFLDSYNNIKYELIPCETKTIKGQKYSFANCFVNLRFYFIEIWTILLIKQNNEINEDYANKIIRKIIDKAKIQRSKIKENTLEFIESLQPPDSYIGYNNPMINFIKKRTLKFGRLKLIEYPKKEE